MQGIQKHCSDHAALHGFAHADHEGRDAKRIVVAFDVIDDSSAFFSRNDLAQGSGHDNGQEARASKSHCRRRHACSVY